VTQHAHTLDSGLLPLPLAPEPLAAPLSFARAITYYKRFKMEADLAALSFVEPPAGFAFHPWAGHLLGAHADVLFASFHGEIDARVFASLGDREGCRGLMNSIALNNGFVPEATWLLTHEGEPCGTVQGIRTRRRLGAIQNLGVLPRYRGHKLGSLLMLQAMRGFARAGLQRVSLEVTSQNDRAIHLYRRLGFRRVKTLYKAVPTTFLTPGG
jgi:ribosomal protein S18 acetylase RimI-like enzyme